MSLVHHPLPRQTPAAAASDRTNFGTRPAFYRLPPSSCPHRTVALAAAVFSAGPSRASLLSDGGAPARVSPRIIVPTPRRPLIPSPPFLHHDATQGPRRQAPTHRTGLRLLQAAEAKGGLLLLFNFTLLLLLFPLPPPVWILEGTVPCLSLPRNSASSRRTARLRLLSLAVAASLVRVLSTPVPPFCKMSQCRLCPTRALFFPRRYPASGDIPECCPVARG